jgi:hypothetical protein
MKAKYGHLAVVNQNHAQTVVAVVLLIPTRRPVAEVPPEALVHWILTKRPGRLVLVHNVLLNQVY